MKTFTHLEIVHLDNETSRDEPSLHHKTTWQMRIYQGAWQKGVSAGGCRNNPETFHINPQLHLILSEIEEVVISLNQHSIMEPKVSLTEEVNFEPIISGFFLFYEVISSLFIYSHLYPHHRTW